MIVFFQKKKKKRLSVGRTVMTLKQSAAIKRCHGGELMKQAGDRPGDVRKSGSDVWKSWIAWLSPPGIMRIDCSPSNVCTMSAGRS